MKHSCVLVCSLLILFSSSLFADNHVSAYPPMNFHVDESLLDSSYLSFDESVNLSLPGKFVSLPDSVLKSLRNNPAFGREGDLLKFFPRQLFIDPANPRNQVIVSNLTSTARQYDEIIGGYDDEYIRLFKDAETDLFTLNGIRCWQGRRMLVGEVRFRLLLDCGTMGPTQLDIIHSVDKNDKKALTITSKTIESIIGSIHKTQAEEK